MVNCFTIVFSMLKMMTRCSFDILLMHLFMTNVITNILFLLQPLLVYFILCNVIIRYMTGEAVVLKLFVNTVSLHLLFG